MAPASCTTRSCCQPRWHRRSRTPGCTSPCRDCTARSSSPRARGIRDTRRCHIRVSLDRIGRSTGMRRRPLPRSTARRSGRDPGTPRPPCSLRRRARSRSTELPDHTPPTSRTAVRCTGYRGRPIPARRCCRRGFPSPCSPPRRYSSGSDSASCIQTPAENPPSTTSASALSYDGCAALLPPENAKRPVETGLFYRAGTKASSCPSGGGTARAAGSSEPSSR